MPEQRRRSTSLVGRAIRDLSYEPLESGAYQAEVLDWPRPPLYKPGGFFVFSDLPPGEHTLALSGHRLQSQHLALSLPVTVPVLSRPGDDELLLVVAAIDGERRRITFPAVHLPRPIRKGAPVIAEGVTTTLDATLDAGTVSAARLADVAGLAAGDLVRVVRDPGLRLRHDPYSTVPDGLARVVGRIGEVAAPEDGIPGVEVRATRVNDREITIRDVAGARIATVPLDGATRVLGLATDLAARTNASGDYNLYFPDAGSFEDLTLEIRGAGFETRVATLTLTAGRRVRGDFTLARI